MSPEQEPAADRPSPEALLEAAEREGRGRLKVFLGAAPGVGKTYAMLQSARRLLAEGIDVVVGVVETHGRPETEALLEGLTVLPRRQIPYRERSLAEFDLDAALARRPRLLLVDELAHSNAPGSRHPKRYQDIEELLDAGIDVHTTVNVQHLESLNDIVARITRIRVRETIPDSVLAEADEIVLIDLTSEELLQRLKEGKVYVPKQAARAIKHFFQPGNLAALRELALRHTAERVDAQMVGYMRRHAISGPWPAGERILVAITPERLPDPLRLIRVGRRLADQLQAPWSAVYLELPSHHRLPDDTKGRIRSALRLAEHLGASAETLPARHLAPDLIQFARARNITRIVVGGGHHSRWLEALFPSLAQTLAREAGDLLLDLVPTTGSDIAAPKRWPPWRSWTGRASFPYLGAIAGTAIAGLVAQLLESILGVEEPSMVFLTGVLIVAAQFGLGPAVLSAVLSATIYNFFFIAPLYTFAIHAPRDVVAILTFLIVALAGGSLAGRMHEQAFAARRRFRTTQALYDFSRKLAATQAFDDLLWVVVHQIAAMLGAQVVLLLPESGRLEIRAGYPPEDHLPEADWASANWAWEKGEMAGAGSETLPNAERLYLPVRTGRGVVAVMGLKLPRSFAALEPEHRRLLDSLLDQTAIGIERALLDREMQDARVLAESDKLRSALMSSISHDLKTPLSSIIGSVTSLETQAGELDDEAKAELLSTIHQEAERLNRFVINLLDMTRLEAGALRPKRDWLDMRELIGTAVARAKLCLGTRQLRLALQPELPLLRLDFTLFEQVLFNLLDNAAKYSPEWSVVRVTARRQGQTLLLEVIDDGPGIPQTDLKRVFDKFYRVELGDRQGAGAGLGLSICKGIVEAHGGTITAVSPVEAGHGTAFVIRLPIEPQPAAAEVTTEIQ